MANKWHIKAASDQLKNLTFAGLEKYAKILKQEVERDAPGSVKDHIGIRKKRIVPSVSVFSSHPKNADVFTEFGTVAHRVDPVNKKVLHWVEDGISYFSKGHWVSGIAPQAWFRKGINRAKKRLKEAF